MHTPRTYKMIVCEDGSSTLYIEEMNETYHSTRGAVGESVHVFLKAGLEYWRMTQPHAQSVNILEIGFGTGLNALLTMLQKKEGLYVHYTSLEPMPIPDELVSKLNYAEVLGENAKIPLQQLHASAWHEDVLLSSDFCLHKSRSPLQTFEGNSNTIDVLYFDAFAPSKQPEMWAIENLEKCFHLLKEDGILVTYCAQGQFKRNLKSVGFEVESLSGAFGKKEMTRAIKKKSNS